MPGRVSNSNHIFAFSPLNGPVFRTISGDSVVFETFDCYTKQFPEENEDLETIDWGRVNPATGPVFVEGAAPGDVLRITVEQIQIADYGVMAACGGEGTLGHLYSGKHGKVLPIRDGLVIFSDSVALPIKPMLGVIGVTPCEAVTTVYPGPHGGNMDNTLVTEGAVLYLPVFEEGALLAIGDVHAVMGDGEIGVSGIEVNAVVRVKLDVEKRLRLANPFLEDEDRVASIASAETLDEAVSKCTEDMAVLLAGKTGLPMTEIAMLMSAAGNAEICQVVDPLKTARFVLGKQVLDQLGVTLPV